MIVESTERPFMFNEMRPNERSVMHWLVGHQNERISISQISSELGLSEQEVDEAVDRLAGHYGLFNVWG